MTGKRIFMTLTAMLVFGVTSAAARAENDSQSTSKLKVTPAVMTSNGSQSSVPITEVQYRRGYYRPYYSGYRYPYRSYGYSYPSYSYGYSYPYYGGYSSYYRPYYSGYYSSYRPYYSGYYYPRYYTGYRGFSYSGPRFSGSYYW